MKKLILILTLMLIPGITQAKVFSTGYVKFDLPLDWRCQFEKKEQVFACSPRDQLKSREVIIAITAKIADKNDTVKAYYNHLKKPKKMKDRHGKEFTSKVNFIKYKGVHNTRWIDAIHLSSEVPNFYTRYLATVKSNLGILVTYSVAKDKQVLYAKELIRMIDSLKVIAKGPRKRKARRKIKTGVKKKKAPTTKPPIKTKEKIIEKLTTTPD